MEGEQRRGGTQENHTISTKTPPTHPLIRPLNGLIRKIMVLPEMLHKHSDSNTTVFWLSPGALEGSGSSGKLVGSISTYPGTCQCP